MGKTGMLAYLVIREGAKWSDVFRLVPGRTITIGRAPTNQIVVKDERCSRYHAEVFMTGGTWTLRDLDSRNGTLVGAQRVSGDYTLSAGDVIRVAHSQLAFVYDLSKAFSESPPAPAARKEDLSATATITEDAENDQPSESSDTFEPTTITHRRQQSKFHQVDEPDEQQAASIPRVGRAATMLCRIAFELAKQNDLDSVANAALYGVFESIPIDSGAILLAPQTVRGSPTAADLEIVASRSDSQKSYYRLSHFFANMVLRENQAMVARNVEGDSNVSSRDSKGEILATSVICAPIRQGRKVIGLIHLYSTNDAHTPDGDDLEFTLAVADNVAQALSKLGREQELTESLSLTQSEITQLRKRLGVESEIVGSSPLMLKVQQDIDRAAPTRATVLIRGESGVGKELVARAIHFASPRKKGPFVCLNCAALTETLLESELFGHERGAFTGATERKIGKFEAADKGTLMLDEIGEMSPSIQAKFLRVLEGHPFERVGGSQAIKVEVRVIAATNRNLEKAVDEKQFRRDLYFRLRVLEISVPPLRKRPPDIVDLANHFLERFNLETGRKIRAFSTEAMRMLQSYRWPGNVRELKNVVERAVVLAHGNYIQEEDLALSNLATAGESGESSAMLYSRGYQPLTLKEIERRHIQATLNATGWNKSKAATILGIERSTLDRKIQKYDLSPPSG